jgi:hypothetical protein
MVRRLGVVVVTIAAVLTFAIPAVAEHPPSRATYRAIHRALNRDNITTKMRWVRVSSDGPYALVKTRAQGAGGQLAWILLHRHHLRWMLGPVISDEGMACNAAPRAVIRDLQLLRYADGRRCSGPYRR